MTKTYDHKRQIKPLHLIDIDKAFKAWFDQKLNLHLKDTKGDRIKVPVRLVSGERWSFAREEGVRNQEGTLILPMIVIARTGNSGAPGEALSRIFADTGDDHVYYKQVNQKSSLIKELNESRDKNIDPSLPIYEVYTHRAPDHRILTYEVSIWTATLDDMNIVTEKIGQELNFKNVRSFQFVTDDGFPFQAFEEDEIENESNLDDYTQNERVVQQIFKYRVPGYFMPESDERRDQFKRYLSQTKMVFKTETVEKIKK